MYCAVCNSEYHRSAKFCEECGAALRRQCSVCSSNITEGAKFCSQCGTPVEESNRAIQTIREPRAYTPAHLVDKILSSRTAIEGERKHVTVLFADLQGSMQLAGNLDPEHLHELLDDYFAILTDAVHQFEGSVNQYTGDGIMALFGAPIAHEDHAQRACHAALRARDILREFTDEQRVRHGLNFSFRIGLNSGDVVVGKIGDDLRMDYTAQGATVGIAQRAEQLAKPGHIFIGGATQRLVSGYFRMRSVGDANVAGLVEPLALFELHSAGEARTRLDVAVAHGLSKFVGRGAEMHALNAALEQAMRGHGQAVGIVGEPGLGKSRLCLEFLEQCRTQGVQVFEAHCPAHGKNIPYVPILELFRNYFGIALHDNAAQSREKVRRKLLALDESLQDSLGILFEFMGVADSKHPAPAVDPELKLRQLHDLVHRVSNAQNSRGQLTVTLIDDLHWIDAGSNAFVDQIVNACVGRRSLVVLNFRPEYKASFSNKQHYQQIPLVPLSDEPLTDLIADLIGRDQSVALLSEQISQWTTGNPFYAEELVNSLIEDGHLVGYKGELKLVTRLDELPVPTSVRSVLAARIDRLPEDAKRLMQTASVIGKEFDASLLEAISDFSSTEQLDAISHLAARDFIRVRTLHPITEYGFQHPLTQEVAYESQLKRNREQIHAAVARAVEARAGEKVGEQAALIAHHWEQASDILQAASWHRRAAEWTAVNDLKASLRHWLRVRELASQHDDSPAAFSLLVSACSYGMMLGWRLGESATEWRKLFEEGTLAAQRTNDTSALAILNMNYSAAYGLNEGRAEDYLRYSSAAVRIADQTGQNGLRCATRLYLSYALAYSGELRRAEHVGNEVIALADGDPHLGSIEAGLSPLISAGHMRCYTIGFMRDPRLALQEAMDLRELASIHGYRTQAGWVAVSEAEVAYRLGLIAETRAAANAARQTAKDSGVSVEIMVVCAECNAFAAEGDWEAVLELATKTLQEIRTTGAMRLWEPNFLAHIANAQIEIGSLTEARTSATEGLTFMRSSKCNFNPCCFPALARTQLALQEPASVIADTLNTFETFIERFEFRIFQGGLYELRASLAGRENKTREREKHLASALDCYRNLKMTNHATRVVELQH